MIPQNSPGPSAPEAGETLAETKTKLQEAAHDTALKIKDATASTTAQAKEEAKRFVSETKHTTAKRIDDYGSAIHDSAKSLEEKDPNLAWFTHRAADRLQGIADYMRTHDFSELRHDAEDLARRHPAIFFGGMFLAGVVLGNVVKASRRKIDYGDPEEADDKRNWSHGSTAQEIKPPELTEASRSAAGI